MLKPYELTILKKKWCSFFAYRLPSYNKTDNFDELSASCSLILNKYDNIIRAGDLNIDPTMTNQTTCQSSFFNQTNLIRMRHLSKEKI